MTNLFHAHIVSGNREDTRDVIRNLLAQYGVIKKNSSDYLEIERVTFSIDDARELKAWQSLVPALGSKKVFVIYTDFITREAENALLKTFEEPVAGTHIILSVPSHEVLLPTLLSRVRVIESKSESTNALASKFVKFTVAERMEFLSEFLEKSDSDDAGAEIRQKTLSLLNGLEQILSKDAKKNMKSIGLIFEYKKYLQMSGASSKMILETLVLTV